jgi:hypothetical protein
MAEVFRTKWVLLPIALSAVFAILFFPVVRLRYEIPLALIFTLLGIGVIWASYLVRAHVFSHWEEKTIGREMNKGRSQEPRRG